MLRNRIYSTIFSEERFLRKMVYNKDGYYIHSTSKEKPYKVTVIMPVFNAENTIKKAINSVSDQSIGFNHIELIIVDDHSTDWTRSIILEYSKSYSNIAIVFMKKITGSPAIPRNIGIDLTKGDYVTFMDADDWLSKKGLEVLYNMLEKTKDSYALGKTVKVYDKKWLSQGNITLVPIGTQ